MKARGYVVILVLSLLVIPLMGAKGCKTPVISGVAYSVPPEIDSVKVQLNFAKNIKSTLDGAYAVGKYGMIEVNASTPDSPFNIGYRLNLAILEDEDIADLEPVTTLPTGEPLPVNIGHAFAQVKIDEGNPHFDAYAYVDAIGGRWLGMAITVNKMDTRYFPEGLTVSKGFFEKDGKPQAIAAVFGPKAGGTSGGFALFANARSLVESVRNSVAPATGHDRGFRAFLFEGPRADEYRANPEYAYPLEEAIRNVLLDATAM